MTFTLEDIASTAVMAFIFLMMGWAMLWAAEKEAELNISTLSSERILVQEEMNHD